MWKKILAVIGILWGGAIVVHWLIAGTHPEGSGAFASGYQAGQNFAVVFGAVMFVSGLYYLFKKAK